MTKGWVTMTKGWVTMTKGWVTMTNREIIDLFAIDLVRGADLPILRDRALACDQPGVGEGLQRPLDALL